MFRRSFANGIPASFATATFCGASASSMHSPASFSCGGSASRSILPNMLGGGMQIETTHSCRSIASSTPVRQAPASVPATMSGKAQTAATKKKQSVVIATTATSHPLNNARLPGSKKPRFTMGAVRLRLALNRVINGKTVKGNFSGVAAADKPKGCLDIPKEVPACHFVHPTSTCSGRPSQVVGGQDWV